MLECLPNTVINIYVVNYGLTIGSQVCQKSSISYQSYDDDIDDKSSPLNPSNMIAMGSSLSPNQTNQINQPAIKSNCQTTDNLKVIIINL